MSYGILHYHRFWKIDRWKLHVKHTTVRKHSYLNFRNRKIQYRISVIFKYSLVIISQSYNIIVLKYYNIIILQSWIIACGETRLTKNIYHYSKRTQYNNYHAYRNLIFYIICMYNGQQVIHRLDDTTSQSNYF